LSQANTKESLASENERRAKLLLQKNQPRRIYVAEICFYESKSQLIKAQIASS
jgi:membrane fusion protein (multidrug efflux system)